MGEGDILSFSTFKLTPVKDVDWKRDAVDTTAMTTSVPTTDEMEKLKRVVVCMLQVLTPTQMKKFTAIYAKGE